MTSFFARRNGFVAGSLCALALLSSQAAQAQQNLIGVSLLPSATGNQVYNLNPATNDGTPIGGLIGAPAASPVLIGLGVQVSTNTLFTFDTASDRLLSLNGNVVTSVFTLAGVGDVTGEGDLDFDPLTGTGFMSTTNGITSNLFSFSTVTSTATLITASISETIDGLAFSATGTLFAVSTSTSTLYTVSTTTGALTAVGGTTGNLGFTVGSLTADIAFAANGILYAALDDQLYTVSTTTGFATLINPSSDPGFTAGSLGNGAAPGLSGIAFVAAPEPGAGALTLAVGPFALGFIARRRKR